jgi:hypothetical protein
MDIKGQQDIAKQRTALEARRIGVEYGSPGGGPGISEGLTQQKTTGLAERRVSAIEEANALRRESQPVQNEDFNRSTYAPLKALAVQQGTDKAFAPIFNAMDAIADNEEFTKGKTYLHFKENWSKYQKSILDGLEKEFVKAANEGDVIRADMLKEAMGAIEADGTGAIIDQAMPATAAAIQAEQATPTGTMKTWVTPAGKITNLPNNVQPPEGSVPYSSGIDVDVGPEGTRIRTGVGRGGADMERKTKGGIESKVLGGKEQLSRISAIANDWKPEYSELGTRFKAAWTGTKAFLGQDISKDDKKMLVGFKKWQRKSIENINLYIKELTGAQMSAKEADRLRLAQPDPGEQFWQGDDPVTFKAKMDDVVITTRAAVARYQYYLSQGLSPATVKSMINSGNVVDLETIAGRME